MDRNLTERLKKLSKELAATTNVVEHHGNEYTAEELESFKLRIEDIQDEIWDIEHIMAGDGEFDYTGKPTKDWT